MCGSFQFAEAIKNEPDLFLLAGSVMHLYTPRLMDIDSKMARIQTHAGSKGQLYVPTIVLCPI